MDAKKIENAKKPRKIKERVYYSCSECGLRNVPKFYYDKHCKTKKHLERQQPPVQQKKYNCDKCCFHSDIEDSWKYHIKSQRHLFRQ